MVLYEDGEPEGYSKFLALRDIPVGEELTYTYPPEHRFMQRRREEEQERMRQDAVARSRLEADHQRAALKARREAEEEKNLK